jgi:hypothetical protein
MSNSSIPSKPMLPTGQSTQNAQQSSSIVRIILMLIPLVIVVGLIAIPFAVPSIGDRILGMFNNATLVQANATVTYNGEPLEGATLALVPVSGGIDATGFPQKDGGYTFMSNMEDGVYTGKYKVVVIALNPGMPPVSYIPLVYGRKDSTPLEIVVTQNASGNVWNWELEGEAPAKKVESAAVGGMSGMTRPTRPGGEGGGESDEEGEVEDVSEDEVKEDSPPGDSSKGKAEDKAPDSSSDDAKDESGK